MSPSFRRRWPAVWRAAILVLGLAAITGCAAPSRERRVIQTADAPAAIGPYAQAVLAGNSLYVSGQIPLEADTGVLIRGDIREQTRQVIKNLSAVLTAAGFTLSDAVQAQVFLSDLNDFAAMNEVYAQYFKTPPARITVQAARLPRDAKIEIALVAIKVR